MCVRESVKLFITLNEIAIASFIIRADPISAELTIIPPYSISRSLNPQYKLTTV